MAPHFFLCGNFQTSISSSPFHLVLRTYNQLNIVKQKTILTIKDYPGSLVYFNRFIPSDLLLPRRRLSIRSFLFLLFVSQLTRSQFQPDASSTELPFNAQTTNNKAVFASSTAAHTTASAIKQTSLFRPARSAANKKLQCFFFVLFQRNKTFCQARGWDNNRRRARRNHG